MHSAITFVIVCDFPVPGGPSRTRLRPVFTSSMARICVLSASITWCISVGKTTLSMWVSSSYILLDSLKPSIISELRIAKPPPRVSASQARRSRSLYIKNLPKEKNPNVISSASTRQRVSVFTAFVTELIYSETLNSSAPSSWCNLILKSILFAVCLNPAVPSCFFLIGR